MGFEFNPLTGTLDLTHKKKDNFSYKEVLSGKRVTVPANQQMLFFADLMVSGNLMVNGLIIQMRQPEAHSTFVSIVNSGETVRIPRDRVLFYGHNFMCNGNLRVEGDLMSVHQF